MAIKKEDIIEMIRALPDDMSVEDIIEAIYVRERIKGFRGRKIVHS